MELSILRSLWCYTIGWSVLAYAVELSLLHPLYGGFFVVATLLSLPLFTLYGGILAVATDAFMYQV